MGRTVAEKFGQHMDIARQSCRGAGASGARNDPSLQELDDIETFAARGATCLGMRRMRAKQMIDGGARRRLPALVQPESGHHAGIIRPPNAGYEARICRRRHDAGRRTHDVSQPIADIDGAARLETSADGADPACMRVDQGSADRRSRTQA